MPQTTEDWICLALIVVFLSAIWRGICKHHEDMDELRKSGKDKNMWFWP